MPTHKTKTTYIDAVQYTGSNDEELETFCGAGYFINASVIFPGLSWANGLKAVWVRGAAWETIDKNFWVVKSNGNLEIMDNNGFEAVYEVV